MLEQKIHRIERALVDMALELVKIASDFNSMNRKLDLIIIQNRKIMAAEDQIKQDEQTISDALAKIAAATTSVGQQITDLKNQLGNTVSQGTLDTLDTIAANATAASAALQALVTPATPPATDGSAAAQ